MSPGVVMRHAAQRRTARRRAGGWREVIVAAVLPAVLAVLVAAGCGTAEPEPHRGTASSCFAFGVHAIEKRLTVTHAPRACAGLSHQQVNIALARAVRAAVGPRPKAAERKAAQRVSKYLQGLFTTIPPARPETATAAPPQPSADRPLQFAALGAWLATAGAGSYLLASWVAAARRRRSGRGARPPAVLAAHGGLAIAGLGLWTAFLAAGASALAWLAVAVIIVIAGLGMATLITGLPDPEAAASARSTAAAGVEAVARTASRGRFAQSGGPAPSAGRTSQVLVVAAHGVLATATILLVLLAAIGAG